MNTRRILGRDNYEDHKKIRYLFTWISQLDKNNNLTEPRVTLLKNLTNDHLQNIVDFCYARKKIVPIEIINEILFREIEPQYKIYEQ